MASTKVPVGPDTLVTVKIAIGGSLNRKFKIPLKDLGANVLPEKVRCRRPRVREAGPLREAQRDSGLTVVFSCC